MNYCKITIYVFGSIYFTDCGILKEKYLYNSMENSNQKVPYQMAKSKAQTYQTNE